MTNEYLKHALNHLQAVDDHCDTLYQIGIDISNSEILDLKQEVLNLLCVIYHDDEEIIDYFAYDGDYGKWDGCGVTMDDGTEFSLHSIDELWTYLTYVHPELLTD